MADESSLREFTLGYLKQVGALVEPPAYGFYEVLLPDEVAARWKTSPYQRLTFDSRAAGGANGRQITFLHYGHPMVEEIINEARTQTANARFYINNVRAEKTGLFAVAEKTLKLTNARFFSIPAATEKPHLYHYVVFNFKAALIADEKRELIVPVWLHLQNGYRVEATEIQRLALMDTTAQFAGLTEAPITWIPPHADSTVFSAEVMKPLLEQARYAALEEMGEGLLSFRRRLKRYLELDRARLVQYYDDLLKDLERRLKNTSEERRHALEEKIAAVQTERQAKLADVAEKYRLRVDLELVNLAVIDQPKIDLLVEIKKRSAAVQRRIVWDPLRHMLEPLVCDVCGRPAEELALCENGHLAHPGCLAPQCIECRRTYCSLCNQEMHRCVVCDGPVCIHSLIVCPDCGRETCQQHPGLCHAANGEPQRAVEASRPEKSGEANRAQAVDAGQRTSQPPRSSTQERTAPPTETAPGKPARKTTPVTRGAKGKSPPVPAVRGQYLEVYIESAEPVVTAYVIARKREIASRRWTLVQNGIRVECWCEKGWQCRSNGLIYRPALPEEIGGQLLFFVREFAREYAVPENKTSFYRVRGDRTTQERKLALPILWKDPETLERSRRNFDKLR